MQYAACTTQAQQCLLISVRKVQVNNWIKHKAELALLVLCILALWWQELVDMWISQPVHVLQYV